MAEAATLGGTTVKVEFDEVGAALAGMTQLGTDPATAATQLSAFFSQLLKPADNAKEAAKDIGLGFDKMLDTLKNKGLPAVLDLIKSKLKGNEDQMAKVFPNIRALRAVLALAAEDGGKVAGVFDRLSDSTGSLDTTLAPGSRVDVIAAISGG